MRAKLMAFAVSGFVAGLAGCLFIVVNQQYQPTAFLASVSLVVFTSTAVGGLGSLFGAILGAAIVEGSAVYLPPSWQLFPAALGVLIVLILFPRGLAGLCYDLRDLGVERLLRRHAGGAAGATGRERPAGPSRPPDPVLAS
jgi:branched-chain amino acid transport system permease protein